MIGMAARLRAWSHVSCRAGRPPSRPRLGAGRRAALVTIGRGPPTAVLRPPPSAVASVADSSTTSRPPPSSGTRITMPRPSLVTSSGPSPVRGFITAILPPLPAYRPQGTSPEAYGTGAPVPGGTCQPQQCRSVPLLSRVRALRGNDQPSIGELTGIRRDLERGREIGTLRPLR